MIKDIDKIISVNWQGWPIYKITFKDFLKKLGASEDDKRILFYKNNPILKVFPRTLSDNNMGYNAYDEWVISATTDNKSHINIFTEPQMSVKDLYNWIKKENDDN